MLLKPYAHKPYVHKPYVHKRYVHKPFGIPVLEKFIIARMLLGYPFLAECPMNNQERLQQTFVYFQTEEVRRLILFVWDELNAPTGPSAWLECGYFEYLPANAAMAMACPAAAAAAFSQAAQAKKGTGMAEMQISRIRSHFLQKVKQAASKRRHDL